MSRTVTALLTLVGLGALALVWGVYPLSHDDLFGHLHAGSWILERGKVPLADPFSFTQGGTPWTSHEWLFSVLTQATHALGGLMGLLALRAALLGGLLLATGWLAWRVADPRGRVLALLPLLLAAALIAGRPELILRAALVSSLLLIATFLLLEAWDRTGSPWTIGGLLSLFWVWGNLHSGVIFGLYVLGLYGAEAMVSAVGRHLATRRGSGLGTLGDRSDPRGGLVGALALLVGCTAVALINPNGADALTYPFRLSAVLFAGDLALDLGHFVTGRPYAEPGLMALAAALVLGLLPIRRAFAVPLRYSTALLTFAVLSWRTPRFYLEAGLLAAVVAFALWSDRAHPWAVAKGSLGRLGKSLGRPAMAALGVALALLAGLEALARPAGTIGPNLPVRAVEFIAEEGPKGRLFHHQNWGAYLGWRLEQPVFWDGRNLVFEPLMRELAGQTFATTIAKYQLEGLLLAEDDHRRLAGALRPDEWGLVYWDDRAALFARRTPANRELLQRHELRQFPPFGGRPGLALLARDPVNGPAALNELDRVLERHPDTQRALYFRAVLAFYRGDVDSARSDLRRAEGLGANAQLATLRELIETWGSASTGP